MENPEERAVSIQGDSNYNDSSRPEVEGVDIDSLRLKLDAELVGALQFKPGVREGWEKLNKSELGIDKFDYEPNVRYLRIDFRMSAIRTRVMNNEILIAKTGFGNYLHYLMAKSRRSENIDAHDGHTFIKFQEDFIKSLEK